MKKHLLYTAALAGALMMTGCADDFLDQENTYQQNQQTFFNSDKAVAAATSALYSHVWYDFNDKFYYGMGDGRANNITAQYSDYIYPYTNFTETSLSTGLTEAWAALYSVVAQANNSMNNIRNYSTSDVSETAKTQAIAEARFMRGTAYWYIASLWGCAILYDDTQQLVDNYVVYAQPQADAMEFAIRDLEYAAVNLPKAQGDQGRVTRYSAYGMLSRVYLAMAGLTTSGRYDGTNVATDKNRGTRNEYYLDMAKKAAEKVIKESGAKLLDNYADLFAAKTQNNNAESLFQLQFLPGAGMNGAGQSMTRFLAWSTTVGDTNAWGGATYCSWDLWKEFKQYADATLGSVQDDAIRRHYSVASYGEVYPELSADPANPYIYGETENASSQGANIKKYVIGTNKVNGFSVPNNSGINTYMLRLAEVYLNYVEAVMGNSESTKDTQALEYFNAIRQRAQMPVKNVVTYEDLRHEFRVELAFEGLYWYQLIRRGYYKQQEVVNYLNNQQRNASYYDASTHEYKLSDTYPLLKTDVNGQITTEAYTFGDREVTDDQLF